MLLTAAKTAQALSMSRSKVYALMAAGELPTVRIGRSVRVPLSELERWLRNRTVNVRTEGPEEREMTQ